MDSFEGILAVIYNWQPGICVHNDDDQTAVAAVPFRLCHVLINNSLRQHRAYND